MLIAIPLLWASLYHSGSPETVFGQIVARAKACNVDDAEIGKAREMVKLFYFNTTNYREASPLVRHNAELGYYLEEVEENAEFYRVVREGGKDINCELYRDPVRRIAEAAAGFTQKK
jgi:hypothetical protein